MTQAPALQPGDLCLTGANASPKFRVIAVDEGRVWVRDVETGADAVIAADRCKRIADDHRSGEDADPQPLASEQREDETQPTTLTFPSGEPRP